VEPESNLDEKLLQMGGLLVRLLFFEGFMYICAEEFGLFGSFLCYWYGAGLLWG
jgi:hypothetical protein